ncbi:MAG: PH domain-containing protein [Chloroflexi bacterium]|nr:PH domain-containing protein [Chloroflexota bacterium]
MGLISGMFGHATDVDITELQDDFGSLLIQDESIITAYRLVRDLIIFTEHRLILVDKQGLTGRKSDYATIPYNSIIRFSMETAGFMDHDAELRLWIRGEAEPLKKEFKKNQSVSDIYRILSDAILT